MKMMLIVRLCMNYDPSLHTVILPHGHSRKVTNLTYICMVPCRTQRTCLFELMLYIPVNKFHSCLVVVSKGDKVYAGGSDLRFYDSSDLKTYLQMRGLGPDVVSVVGPTGV